LGAVLLLALGSLSCLADQRETTIAGSTLDIRDLGKGTAPLTGPWRFHFGDNPNWAAADFDDSAWQQIEADRPWGEQGHPRSTGFAWYRCTIQIAPAAGVPPQFALLVPNVDDAYEVYWNGALIGHNGKLGAQPVWYYSQAAQAFSLGNSQRGTLAVRVWKAPLLSDDSGQTGGFESAPIVGAPQDVATAKDALEYRWLRSRQFLFGENLIFALIALFSLLLWCRNSSRWLLFWTAGFALVPPLNLVLLNAHLPWPYTLAMGIDQPLSSVRDISLWFLLLLLLRLNGNRAVTRLTRILAVICLVNATFDGLIVAISWRPQWTGLCQAADAASTTLYMLIEAFPLVLVGCALFKRTRLAADRWLLAWLAFLNEMIVVVRNVTKQGRQFTGLSFASRIDSPLITLGGSAISLYTLIGALLLICIVYAVFRSVRTDQWRQDALEREKADLMRAGEQMRYHAEHDGLTGLWNHRIIVERLRSELDRSQREGTQLSVILADVDFFKQINDSFGHQAGDAVLKEIGDIFTRSVRSYDWVGRYGGEEFLLILPGSGMDDALDRAEELRQAVQGARILENEPSLELTVSFGVASSSLIESGAEAVIQTVDAALYRAKNSGRNCVVAAHAEASLGELKC
jgi:diguanylate cyclase (GGDEF)-like protein